MFLTLYRNSILIIFIWSFGLAAQLLNDTVSSDQNVCIHTFSIDRREITVAISNKNSIFDSVSEMNSYGIDLWETNGFLNIRERESIEED